MKKWLCMLLAFALLVTPVFAEEGEETEGEEAAYREIYTVEDLLRLPENPEGSYRLMADLDMTESTVVMLVSALAGREHVLHAYDEAIKERYRFFSFGDAMFIHD